MTARFGDDYQQQQQLIKSLTSADCYNHQTQSISIIETHISWVILSGPYAYKIKKSLDLGFLDYSTLSLRQQYCEQELEINSRTAADIYLSCVAISGPVTQPQMDNSEQIIEYAVKMKQFSQQALLSHLADNRQFTDDMVDQLADKLAEFHHTIRQLPPDSSLGTPETIWHPIEENFDQINEHLNGDASLEALPSLLNWARQQYQQLNPLLQSRKQQGFMRQCHGDLHLGNIAYINHQICMFDAIEFNPALSWIDVISELAFLCMDLEARGFKQHSYRLLNLYLQHTGDYSGLKLFHFYQLYRAMVRAKVTAISLTQACDNNKRLHAQFCHYLELASTYTKPGKPWLIISHGLSGSGKSYYSEKLAAEFHCIHLSSDIERKRLYGLSPLENSKQLISQNIYTSQANARTYQRLLDLSAELLSSGFNVVVDATFLRQSSRKAFHELALSYHSSFIIMDLETDTERLRHRIQQRQQQANNPSEADIAIMEQQLINQDPLSTEEQPHVWPVISGNEQSWKQFRQRLANLVKYKFYTAP